MSHNDWEAGTITLPAAEYAKVRQAVQNAAKAHKEQAFALAQEFWKGLTRTEQTNPEAFRKALNTWRFKSNSRDLGSHSVAAQRRSDLYFDASCLADTLHRNGGKPRRATVADACYPTNRTTTFHISGTATIVFNKDASSIHWEAEGNHGVESGRGHVVGSALFSALAAVRWTRNTGGHFTGNDEYNTDDRKYGSSANYVTLAFGPIGAAGSETWSRTDDYRDGKGNMVRQASFPGRVAQEEKWARTR